MIGNYCPGKQFFLFVLKKNLCEKEICCFAKFLLPSQNFRSSLSISAFRYHTINITMQHLSPLSSFLADMPPFADANITITQDNAVAHEVAPVTQKERHEIPVLLSMRSRSHYIHKNPTRLSRWASIPVHKNPIRAAKRASTPLDKNSRWASMPPSASGRMAELSLQRPMRKPSRSYSQ